MHQILFLRQCFTKDSPDQISFIIFIGKYIYICVCVCANKYQISIKKNMCVYICHGFSSWFTRSFQLDWRLAPPPHRARTQDRSQDRTQDLPTGPTVAMRHSRSQSCRSWHQSAMVNSEKNAGKSDVKIQWIGLRENLQESPIFNGKIYGFL